MSHGLYSMQAANSGAFIKRNAIPLAVIATVSSGVSSYNAETIIRAYNDNSPAYHASFNLGEYFRFRDFAETSGGFVPAYNSNDIENTITNFAVQLLKDTHDVPEEFARILEENFWDVLA